MEVKVSKKYFLKIQSRPKTYGFWSVYSQPIQIVPSEGLHSRSFDPNFDPILESKLGQIWPQNGEF